MPPRLNEQAFGTKEPFMNLSNVRWIFLREVRDQLRDRRTLFTIAVMPLLLYPLLGASFLQVAQFMREHPTRILILGRENLPESPALIVEGAFAPEVCDPHERELLQLTLESAESFATPTEVTERATTVVDSGRFDAVVYFPPDFAGASSDGSSGGSAGSGAVASAPITRGAAAPHRVWSDARAAETSGERLAIGRPD